MSFLFLNCVALDSIIHPVNNKKALLRVPFCVMRQPQQQVQKRMIRAITRIQVQLSSNRWQRQLFIRKSSVRIRFGGISPYAIIVWRREKNVTGIFLSLSS